eukprot:2653965-Amphidinium_carterae.1
MVWSQGSKPYHPRGDRSISPSHMANASTAASTYGYPGTDSSRAQSRGWSPARSSSTQGTPGVGRPTPPSGGSPGTLELGWDE